MLQLSTETELNHPQSRLIRLSKHPDLENFSKCSKQCISDFCELQKTKLCTLSSHDPKIKVVPHIKYYNFALVTTYMQGLQHIVQTWSNMLRSNDGIHSNYGLVSKLSLTMNTKVVHNDTLNMFKLVVRSHNHFIHQLHIKLSSSTYIASLKCLIMKGDLHEQCSIC